MKRLAIVLLYLVVLSASSLILLTRFEASGRAVELDSTVFIPDGTLELGQLPGELAGSAIDLPVDSRHHDAASGGWYRLRLSIEEAGVEPWSLVIPAVRMNAEVYLNGTRIGDGGRLDTPVARNLRRPLIFNLPSPLLHDGDNEIMIRVIAGPDQISYLAPVYAGPDSDLRPAYRQHHFIRITLVQIITVAVLLIGGMIGVLGYIRRADREYAYFSLCTLIWALHSFSYFTVNIPVGDRLWDWLVAISIGFFALLGGLNYVHRYLGLYLPRIERPALIGGGVLAIVMLLLPGQWFYFFSYYIWLPLSQLAGTYGLLRMLHAARARQSIELHIIAASGSVLVGYAMHDLLLVFGLLDWGRGYIIQYSMPFILLLFCIMLLRRFVASIEEVETMKNTLEGRVEERRLELEQTYARLRESEQQRLLAEERHRIMRDMHDGVGGQLVSAITLAKNDATDTATLGHALENALRDLRLMIDSLDNNSNNLPVLLGLFRRRIEPALQAQGISLSWQVDAIGDLENFGSQQALHVLRILQEFFTNSLRHSGATRVELRAYEKPADNSKEIVIESSDNGSGLDGASPGHGMRNMRQRAEAIGAGFEFQSDLDGTRLRLSLLA